MATVIVKHTVTVTFNIEEYELMMLGVSAMCKDGTPSIARRAQQLEQDLDLDDSQ